jgi:hypothetical protein
VISSGQSHRLAFDLSARELKERRLQTHLLLSLHFIAKAGVCVFPSRSSFLMLAQCRQFAPLHFVSSRIIFPEFVLAAGV